MTKEFEVEETLSKDAIQELLSSAGLGKVAAFERLAGGGNNRVYRVETESQKFLLKHYFHHPGDQRDRLQTEFEFSRFLWGNQVRSLPQPIACNPALHLGLYQFIEGRRLSHGEVRSPHIDEALAFLRSVNALRDYPEARKLGAASEACFSFADHMQTVQRRIDRLKSISGDSPTDHAAKRFFAEELEPSWRQWSTQTRADLSSELHVEVPQSERWLSPSDFGFHNALLTADNTLVFLDFEYAGWDEPGKLICDVPCQPPAKLSEQLISQFHSGIMKSLHNPEFHMARVKVLKPLCYVKWSCILLNEFLPIDSARRSFAAQKRNLPEHKAEQLSKAREMLERFSLCCQYIPPRRKAPVLPS